MSADPAQNTIPPENDNAVEEKINSEVELLNNAELLQRVALDNGLEKRYLNSSKSNRAVAIERATRDLSKQISINPVRRSSIINVSYISSDRNQAKAVLDSLSEEYLHLYAKLYHADGAAAFYAARSQTLNANLHDAENQRAKLLQENGYMLLPEGQTLGLTQVAELEKSRSEAVTSLVETRSRLQNVMKQKTQFSDRRVTQRRISASPVSVDQLNTKLVDLENRRTELRAKFVDGDPLVLQIEQQIADTRQALTAAGKMQFEDVTTDVNPVRQSLDDQASQLVESQAGLTSRLNEINQQLVQQNGQLIGMQQARIDLDNLDRMIKVLQEGVSLYENKGLVARASEEMNLESFSNVVEASYPTVPVLPIQSRFTFVTSLLLSILLSLAIGLAYGWWVGGSAMTRGARLTRLQTMASN